MSDPLLKYLKHPKREALGDPGHTIRELALEIYGEDTPGTREKVRCSLRPLLAEGKAVAGKAQRLNMAQCLHRETVYRAVKR